MEESRKRIVEFVQEHTELVNESEQILSHQFHPSDDDNAHQNYGLSNNVHLHRYQIAAIEWIKLRHLKNLSCIIADEMGLGKTLQALGFLNYHNTLLNVKELKYLIICPLSVIPTWQAEIDRCLVDWNVIVYIGTKIERQHIQNKLLDCIHLQKSEKDSESGGDDDELSMESRLATDTSSTTWRTKSTTNERILGNEDINDRTDDQESKRNAKCHVIITSYDIFLRDFSVFDSIDFVCLIMDEAHRLKSFKGRLYQKLIHSRLTKSQVYRMYLTGTPLQNNMMEFWCLLHMICPSLLPDADIAVPLLTQVTQSGAPLSSHIRKLIDIFMLRRTRNEVPESAWILPNKVEYDLFVPMTPLQRTLYLSLLSQSPELMGQLISLRSKDDSKAPMKNSNLRGLMNNLLMQLRKCANHPYLFPKVEPEPFKDGPHLWMASGKLILMEKLFNHFKSIGSRLLVFSGSTRMLDILQDHLDLRGDLYERLDGSVRGRDRAEAVSRFTKNKKSKKDNVPFVFLLSTRAGGLGLNLATADVVIFVDTDWNPQIDLQALSRSFRQGQEKEVKIIRLFAANTVDEIVWKRSQQKLEFTLDVLNETFDHSVKGQVDIGTLANYVTYGIDQLAIEKQKAAAALHDIQCVLNDITKPIETDPWISSLIKLSIEEIFDKGRRHDNSQMKRPAGENASEETSSLITTPDSTFLDVNKKSESQGVATKGIYEFEGRDYFKAKKQTGKNEDPIISALKRLALDSKCQFDSRSRGNQKPNFYKQTEQPFHHTKKSPLTAAERKNNRFEQCKESGMEFVDLSSRSFCPQTYVDVFVGLLKCSNMIIDKDVVAFSYILIKLEEKWLIVHGYISHSIMLKTDGNLSANNQKLNAQLHHVTGDASQPFVHEPFVILHCVDATGRWPSAGFFVALRKQFGPFVQNYYETAGRLKDLKMGDLHFVPIPPSNGKLDEIPVTKPTKSAAGTSSHPDDKSRPANRVALKVSDKEVAESIERNEKALSDMPTQPNRWIAFLVGQRRHDVFRASGSDAFDIAAIRLGLIKLQQAIADTALSQISLHLPRIVSGGVSNQWYSIERLLQRYIVEKSISTWVYYFPRRQSISSNAYQTSNAHLEPRDIVQVNNASHEHAEPKISTSGQIKEANTRQSTFQKRGRPSSSGDDSAHDGARKRRMPSEAWSNLQATVDHQKRETDQ